MFSHYKGGVTTLEVSHVGRRRYCIVWLVCLLGKVRKPFTELRQEGRLLQLVVLALNYLSAVGCTYNCADDFSIVIIAFLLFVMAFVILSYLF